MDAGWWAHWGSHCLFLYMFANFHDKKARILIKMIEKKDNIHYNAFCFSWHMCPFPSILISLNLNKFTTSINFWMRDYFLLNCLNGIYSLNREFLWKRRCMEYWYYSWALRSFIIGFLTWFLFSSISWQDSKIILI